MPYVVTVFVVAGSLGVRIEVAAFARIITDACHVIPVAPVAAYVIIDEYALEPGRAPGPVDAQVVGQETGDILPSPI